ncbi:MAG: STAS domain-containing protein [Byssovorax sp.]
MDIDFREPHPLVLVMTPILERLDAVSAGELREIVKPRLHRRILVVMDLSHVQSIDSTGLGVLVSLLKALPRGGQLRLVHVTRSVRSLLSLTRLDRIFRIFEDVPDALMAFQAA